MKLCGACNGSGEGQYDGSRCIRCGGSGEFWIDDNERDEYDDEDFETTNDEETK